MTACRTSSALLHVTIDRNTSGCIQKACARTCSPASEDASWEEVPRLTAAQEEAVGMVIDLAEELCFEMPLEPGDLQLLNNHVIYHGRTPFTDDAAAGRDRLLYRLWLSMPNSRPLPESHRALWGRIEAGALRGGATASLM